MSKTAIVIGATGLVGSELLNQLIDDRRIEKIKVFSRRVINIENKKIEINIVDFDNIEQWGSQLTGDVLFSAMGTTIKKAKTKENQYKIDYTYQFKTALHSANNSVSNYVLISSAGASEKSNIFYSRMKGELERDIQKLAFKKISILRPGILYGARLEKRTGEKIGIIIAKIFSKIPGLGKFRPIHASIVAKAMINANFNQTEQTKSYTLEAVFKLAE